MKEIILKVLEDVACSNTGTCQINMQSESAREMIADKLQLALEEFMKLQISDAIEEVICCRGDCHG